jgi:pyridoxal phosphate enzyme (YggS family)
VTIGERFAEVKARIGRAAEHAGRDPADVTLIAVSKTFPSHVIAEAIEAGVTDLGENRAQELKEKAAVLGPRPRWHFIGHLQTNKVRQVVGAAVLIHSVDRLGLADAIARRAEVLGITRDVLIEVNISGERSKQGVEPPGAIPLALEVAQFDSLRVRGLMTVPPLPDEPEDSRPFYSDMASLSRRLQNELPDATALSMGMTRDFEVAVEEGATFVRVGEAIFGPRPR